VVARHVEVPDRLRTLKRAVPEPAKRLGRVVLRDYGVRTARSRPLPDFLIIGAKRGGTTSLWNYLVKHPQVMPMFPAVQQIKSPHYFDINYAKGERWYRSTFPTATQRRAAQARTGKPVVTGEASPYYMFHPLAAERAAALVPRAKIVVSLRNPVDRAYSNYHERRGCGVEPLETFEEALAAEDGRLRGEEERILADPTYYSPSHDSHTYRARGRYLEHLDRWLTRYDPADVLVLLQEDLARDAHTVFTRLCDFLQIDTVTLPDYVRHNHLPVQRIAPETRRELVEYYRPHNAALAERLGIDLPWDR